MVRGPNGAGKSSLLRQMAGFVPLTAGDVRLGERSLAADRAGFQDLVAYAGHLDAVKPALTVAQNLEGWAAIFEAPSGRVDAALARFGLDSIAGRPVAECSAGQKRRLGLSRLLIMDRPLWLLDEPTVSLDADASVLVAELVLNHIADGGLALIATHIDLGLGNVTTLEILPDHGEGKPWAQNAPAEEADAFLSGEWT
jgi:heme exporter protein A